MRLTTRQTGVISYAGMDEKTLLESAKHLFALAEDAPPERFADLIPLFPAELIVNMRYLGEGRFSSDPAEYHQKLLLEMPELYTGENALRCLNVEGAFRKGAVMTVDAAWAEHFPQYRPFLGEKLMLYRIGGGHQAAAVPCSLFPCGGGVLEEAERQLHIAQRCAHFTGWLVQQLEAGQRYDPPQLEERYLQEQGLKSVCIRQSDLNRALNEVRVLRSLNREESCPVEASCTVPPQYVPYRYACDVFEPAPVTRRTARLLQLHFSGEKTPGDFWLPYQDASQYIHKRRGTLDVRALCEGFQIAPACDADMRGGCYPDCVRVVVVRR